MRWRAPLRPWLIGIVVVALSGLGLPACGGGPGTAASNVDAAPGPAAGLTVDGLTNPIGLGPTDVFFGWHVNDPRRGAVQSAYELVVKRMTVGGNNAGATAPVWDSGEVRSRAQAFVPYAGPSLASDAVYRWSVRTWDAGGHPSPMATTATFETGLTDRDWHADWIRRPASTTTEPDQYTYARKEFSLTESPIVRARAYVSGDQQYEMYV